MRFQTIFSAGLSLVRTMSSLFSIWLTLDWEVRKARKAFEMELVKAGMTKQDARRISRKFKDLKDELVNSAKSYIFIGDQSLSLSLNELARNKKKKRQFHTPFLTHI